MEIDEQVAFDGGGRKRLGHVTVMSDETNKKRVRRNFDTSYTYSNQLSVRSTVLSWVTQNDVRGLQRPRSPKATDDELELERKRPEPSTS